MIQSTIQSSDSHYSAPPPIQSEVFFFTTDLELNLLLSGASAFIVGLGISSYLYQSPLTDDNQYTSEMIIIMGRA